MSESLTATGVDGPSGPHAIDFYYWPTPNGWKVSIMLEECGIDYNVVEVDRLAGVMDAQLSVNTYLAGPDYSIADMATWPWAMLLGRLIDENLWTSFPHLKRWVDD